MDAENDNDQPNSSSASASSSSSSSNNSSSSNLLGHLPMLPFMRSTDDDEQEANEADGNDNVNDLNEEPMPLQPPVTVAMATVTQPASASVQQPTMAPITTTTTVTGAGTSTASSSSVGREEPMVGAEQLAVLMSSSSASSLPPPLPPHSLSYSSTSYLATTSSSHINRLPSSAFLPSANPSQVIFSPFLFDMPALTSAISSDCIKPLSPQSLSHSPLPFIPISLNSLQNRVTEVGDNNNTPPLMSSLPSSSSMHQIHFNLAQSELSPFHEQQDPIPNFSSFSISSQQQQEPSHQASLSTPQTTTSIIESRTSVALTSPSSLLQQPSEYAPGHTQQQEQSEQQLTAQIDRYDIADTIDASAVIVQPLEASAEIGHQSHLYPQEAANSEAEVEQSQNNIQLDDHDNNDFDVDLNVRNDESLATTSNAVVAVETSSAQQPQSQSSTSTGQQQTAQPPTTLPLFNQQQQQQQEREEESKHLPSFDHHYHNPREFHLHAHPYQHPCVYPYGFRSTSRSQSNKNTNGAHNYTAISPNITSDIMFGNNMSSSHRKHGSHTSGLGGIGNTSSSPQVVDRLKLLYPNVDENETPLPRCWSPHEKCLAIGLSQNNLRVQFKGLNRQPSTDAASVRTAHPIPAACGIYYFEVKIISKGKNGYMGIGLTAQHFRMNRLPGWDKQSYGYHGDDGNSFSSSGHGQSYGPTFTTGDIIGCCVNFVNNTCFYTKNGIDLGIAFRDLPSKLYPTVGLQTPGEEVDANFGQEPFKFDQIEDMMKQMRSETKANIYDFPIPAEQGDPTTLLQKMVSSYLVHNGYSQTAEAFAKQQKTGQNIREENTSIRNRQKILKMIMAGKIGQAIEQTIRSYPGLLENNKKLWFMLRCRQFIEMINGSDTENGNETNNDSNSSITTDGIVTITTGVTTATTISNTISNSNSNTTTANNNTPTTATNANTATVATITTNAQNSSHIAVIHTDDNDMKTQSNLVEHCSASNDASSTISKSNNDSDYLNDVEMENNSHTTNGSICKNGNANNINDSLDTEEEMDVDVTPSVKKYSNDIQGILAFGKDLSQMGKELEKEDVMTDEEKKMLEDAFSLIAYSNPWASPLGWQLSPTRRETVCRALNSAILESMNCSKWPPLEYCVAHANELLKIMAQSSIGDCAFVNISDVFPQN